jgi:oxalate decarboxylase/phosphoglucose isomerase-like protein (cupin superfamily)
MDVYNFQDFPFIEFGENPARKIRLLVSPQTTGEQRCSIVISSLSPGAISEGHIHEESDEYIYFDIGGKFIAGKKEYEVKEKSVAFAPKGTMHVCLNTTTDKELTLVCFFLPPFTPYGKYPELIKQTKEYIEKEDNK